MRVEAITLGSGAAIAKVRAATIRVGGAAVWVGATTIGVEATTCSGGGHGGSNIIIGRLAQQQ